MELRVVGHRSGGSPSARRAVEVGAAEWVAQVSGTVPADLYFLRARYYDPGTGRFLSRDKVEGVQRYAYAGGNPVLYVDANGLCKRSWNPKDWADCTVDLIDRTRDVATWPTDRAVDLAKQVSLNQALSAGILSKSRCSRSVEKEGITFHYSCGGSAEVFLIAANQTAFTVGTDVFTYRTELSSELRRHEACHVGQYDRYGDSFLPISVKRRRV